MKDNNNSFNVIDDQENLNGTAADTAEGQQNAADGKRVTGLVEILVGALFFPMLMQLRLMG